ncbi:MAG: hypothetical protein ACRCXL_08010 [Dermatophilaceae bacterium]
MPSGELAGGAVVNSPIDAPIVARDGVLDLLDGGVHFSEIGWVTPHPMAFRASSADVRAGPDAQVHELLDVLAIVDRCTAADR